jgi:hypothetical protein
MESICSGLLFDAPYSAATVVQCALAFFKATQFTFEYAAVLAVGIKHPKFKTGTTCVEYQDVHEKLPVMSRF